MSVGPSCRHLVAAHYHLRPGGVRRVIETALPALAERGGLSGITLATGEAPAAEWLERVRRSVGGMPVDVHVDPGFLYSSEIPASRMRAADLEATCSGLLRGRGGCVLWAHNLGLGRNAALAAAWVRAVQASGAVFVSHHHDFFFDNRWGRWPEMRAAGVDNLEEAARAIFPAGPRTVHVAINRTDHALLASAFGDRAVWIPNPAAPERHSIKEAAAAREWLAARTGSPLPFWLLPCRLLRRKNVAEAVLLARWLRPGARVVTTGAPTSPDEEAYAARLSAAARSHGWPLQLSVLAGAADAPPVQALVACAEAVTLTSLQEGFGLPYLEAATARRPLVARALPNVLPDLLSLGMEAPVTYEDILIPGGLFDAGAEQRRQRMIWERWRAGLPEEVRSLAGEPPLLSAPGTMPAFSRLTLTAQEEVLAHSDGDLASALGEANPGLAQWRGAGPDLPPAALDGGAQSALSPARFAENFFAAVERSQGEAADGEAPFRALQAFLADRLRGGNLYPLVFATET